MIAALLQFSLHYVFFCVLVAMLFCTVRLVLGPSAHDRVLTLDTLWMCAMQLALVLGMRFASDLYFEAAMLIALLGFVSTVAMAKFLMRGEVIE